MARRRAVILKPKTWQIIARIIRDYLAGRLTNRPGSDDARRGRGGDRWGFGKATATLTPGALTTPDTIADDKGPAYSSGAGLATGRTISPDWSLEAEDIASGDWVVWERKHSKVYVSLLSCPTE